ncbi:Mpv17/PMP22 family protein [Microdochium nivale]|nr:Mpv17/PMP22 family protein [Microdochium nivale]
MPLHKNPMAKATLAATALAATSNVLAQLLVAHRNGSSSGGAPVPHSLDVMQILRYAFLVFLTTPPNYLWQALLERTFPAHGGGGGEGPEDSMVGVYAPEKRGDSRADRKKRTSSNGGGFDNIDLEKAAGPSSSSSSSFSSSSPPLGAGAVPGRRKLDWNNTLTKWFIDCITLGALFNTVAFYVLMGLLKNQGLAQILANVRDQTMPLILAGYRIWPLASIVSFTVVPVEKRVVFLNFVGLLWGVYMSLVADRV